MKKVTLDEVCELIVDCEHKTAPKQDAGYPSIRTPNIGRGYFILENVNRVSRETYEKWTQRAVPQYGDLIIAREAPVGNVAMIPKGLEVCLGQRTVLIRPDQTKTDSRFLTYLLLGDEVQGSIHSQTNGATVAHLNMRDIRSLELPFLPDLPTQRKIAGILSAYDDLIENNLRRIKILEEMAQSLYREWFVHFRFPGHESARFIDSELGLIPKGWAVVPMGDFVQFRSGFAFKSSKFTEEGEHRLVTIKNVQDGVFNPVSDSRMDELPEKLPSYCILKDGDILLSLTGNVGRVCLVYAGPFLLNQRIAKLSPVSSFDWMLAYCVFRSPEMRNALEMLSNGVAQQNLSPVQASKMNFTQPPEILRERFASIAEPIGCQIIQLYNANQNLRRTRDLLLPKLLPTQH